MTDRELLIRIDERTDTNTYNIASLAKEAKNTRENGTVVCRQNSKKLERVENILAKALAAGFLLAGAILGIDKVAPKLMELLGGR